MIISQNAEAFFVVVSRDVFKSLFWHDHALRCARGSLVPINPAKQLAVLLQLTGVRTSVRDTTFTSVLHDLASCLTGVICSSLERIVHDHMASDWHALHFIVLNCCDL